MTAAKTQPPQAAPPPPLPACLSVPERALSSEAVEPQPAFRSGPEGVWTVDGFLLSYQKAGSSSVPQSTDWGSPSTFR